MKKSKRNGLLVPLLIIFLVTITVFGIMIEHGVADVLFTQGTIKEETSETTDKESDNSFETHEYLMHVKKDGENEYFTQLEEYAKQYNFWNNGAV